ncbi:MAG: MBL fold metallo-hydrolase [Anaerolineae bacterium]
MAKEIANGVFVASGYEGGNSGAILTEKGALLVDTPMLPQDAREWHWTVTQLGGGVIYGIVNTDYHLEHILGNAVFMPTRIIGHEYSVRQIAKYKSAAVEEASGALAEEDRLPIAEATDPALFAPELTVEDRLTLYMGDRRVEVLFLNGHTPASIGVYLPAERVLFAGDNVVCNDYPVMAQANSLAWIETLERMKGMDLDVIVPGLGEPCGPETLDPLIDYIIEARQRVADLFHVGASRRETVDRIDMQDHFPIPDGMAAQIKRRRRETVERLYAEIRTAERKR